MANDLDYDRYRITDKVNLSKLDTSDTSGFEKEEAKEMTARLGEQLAELQTRLYAESKHRILIIVQGTDTSGKDGLMKSLLASVEPMGVRIAAFKAPSEVELAHDYLWRVHQQVPRNGEIVLFNRSHYEDVLVVRVHDLVPKKRWEKRYEHIANFEQMLVDEGTTIIKFFLHISKDEQRQRLQDRVDDPTKHWKFNPQDLEERKLWDDYQDAYQEALERTSTKDSPWYVIPADKKWFRDLLAASIVRDTLESLKMKYPETDDFSDIVVK